MQATLKKIRASREFTAEIAGWRLKLRRPTDAEANVFAGERINHIEIATQFVIGWEGVTEADLVPSGASEPVAFDRDLWAEVIEDEPELWPGITEAVMQAFLDYRARREDRKKN